MCGRFELNIPKDKLIQKFGIDNWQLDNFQARFNIPPTSHIPIIRGTGGKRVMSYAHWGLIPSWAKDKKIAYKTFNARSETVHEKPSFRNAYSNRRCLIPTTGYYEWKKLDNKNKQPYWIGRRDKEVFVMAGIYEDWKDNDTGELIRSCSVITCESHVKLSDVHHRMPVMLPKENMQSWLTGSQTGFPVIDMEELNFYPISHDVGSPKNDYMFQALSEK